MLSAGEDRESSKKGTALGVVLTRQLVSLQVPINAARDFVCQALLRLISDENTEGKTPIAHLLLEAVPPDNGVPRTSDKAAAHLFSVCCCAERARLAVKVCKHTSVAHLILHWCQLCLVAVRVLHYVPGCSSVLGQADRRGGPAAVQTMCAQSVAGQGSAHTCCGVASAFSCEQSFSHFKFATADST